MNTTNVRSRSPWLGLSLVLVAFLVRLINATITSTELPALEQELNVPGPTAELTMTLFLALAGALVAPMGMLADRYGRIRVFSFGTVAMIIANLGSALAPNFTILLVTRVLEAVAFPAMGAASLALVASTFSQPRQRSWAFAIYGACYGVAIALSGVIGGLFVTDFSWRWSFAMNIPFLVLALIGVNALLRRDDDPHPEREFDLGAAILLVIGVGALFISIQRLPVDGLDLNAVILLGLTVVSLTGFVIWERRRISAGRQVVLDPTLLRTPGFLTAGLTSALMMFGAFAVLTVLPLYWILVEAAGPLDVGVGLMPLGLGWSVGAILAVPVSTRLAPRSAVTWALSGAAVLLAATGALLPGNGPWSLSAVPLLGAGIGLGIAYARLNEAGLSHVADRFVGLGSGILIGLRFLAAGLGAAVLAQGLMVGASSLAIDAVRESDLSPPAIEKAEHAVRAAARGSYGPLLAEERSTQSVLVKDLRVSYTTAAQVTLWAAAGFVGLAAISGRQLSRGRSRSKT